MQQMKMREYNRRAVTGLCRILLWLSVFLPVTFQGQQVRELNFEESASPADYPRDGDGWRLLLEGPGLAGWRGRGSVYLPEKWQLEKKILRYEDSDYGVSLDLLFNYRIEGDFELELEYRTEQAVGWSAICYFARDIVGMSIYRTSLLMVIGSGQPRWKAGSLYNIIAAGDDHSLSPGKWNKASVRVSQGKATHRLNGYTVAVFDLSGSGWQDLLSRSALAREQDTRAVGVLNEIPGRKGGYIGIKKPDASMDFRNIRIRML